VYKSNVTSELNSRPSAGAYLPFASTALGLAAIRNPSSTSSGVNLAPPNSVPSIETPTLPSASAPMAPPDTTDVVFTFEGSGSDASAEAHLQAQAHAAGTSSTCSLPDLGLQLSSPPSLGCKGTPDDSCSLPESFTSPTPSTKGPGATAVHQGRRAPSQHGGGIGSGGMPRQRQKEIRGKFDSTSGHLTRTSLNDRLAPTAAHLPMHARKRQAAVAEVSPVSVGRLPSPQTGAATALPHPRSAALCSPVWSAAYSPGHPSHENTLGTEQQASQNEWPTSTVVRPLFLSACTASSMRQHCRQLPARGSLLLACSNSTNLHLSNGWLGHDISSFLR
jgi:hypothetical protein